MPRLPALAPVLGVALALAGCGAKPSPGEGGTGMTGPLVLQETWPLAPQGYAEANLRMEKDASLDVTFTAGHELKWDLHSHDAATGRVVNHREGQHASQAFSFTAPAAGEYSAYWENSVRAESTTLEATIRGEATVVSTAP